jgi:hypothetical protein
MPDSAQPDAAARPELLAAIVAAQVARLDLTGLLVAHRIPAEQLPLLLQLPGAVQHALDQQHQALLRVAQLLAARDGAENWSAVPLPDKQRFQLCAFELVDSLSMPDVPHASTPPLA